jgi:chorismate mutase/prephenate dehydratase
VGRIGGSFIFMAGGVRPRAFRTKTKKKAVGGFSAHGLFTDRGNTVVEDIIMNSSPADNRRVDRKREDKVQTRSKKEDSRKALKTAEHQMDLIDEQIMALLCRRQMSAAAMGQLRQVLGMDVCDHAQEEEKLRRLTAMGNGGAQGEAIRTIFREIISASRAVQAPISVAFLGPEGSFSHQAALSLFGHCSLFRASEDMEDVFRRVENGVCQRGLVPVENSYEGAVNNTMDLLYHYDLKIVAETFLRIRHHLLTRAEGPEAIKNLYSHPMALAQCRFWIKTNLTGVTVKEVDSTSTAARIASEQPASAAVGSRLAAETYGLQMLCRDIEDFPQNVTRFVALGKRTPALTGKDKTSLLFSLSHKPGALFRILAPLAKKEINLTRIESRPTRIRSWEYLFFVDIEGHEQDQKVGRAVKEMEEHCAFMKRLGSYPAGGDPWE